MDNHDSVVTHIEPVILECEIKWDLRRITKKKDSEGDGIPAELFQILKDYSVKVLHSIYCQISKPQQWPHDWKISVFIPIPKKGSAKECSDSHTFVLTSHASKVMLKILQDILQQYMYWEVSDIQSEFGKGRGTRDKIASMCWIIGKTRKFQKNIYFCFIDYKKAFDYVGHKKLWKIFKRWEYQNTLPTSWETCM